MATMTVNGESVAIEILSTTRFDNGGENVRHSVRLLEPVQTCVAGDVISEGDLYSKVSEHVATLYGIKACIFP